MPAAMRALVEELRAQLARGCARAGGKAALERHRKARQIHRARADRPARRPPVSPFLEFFPLSAANGMYDDGAPSAGIVHRYRHRERYALRDRRKRTPRSKGGNVLSDDRQEASARARRSAAQNHLPCIYLVDSGGRVSAAAGPTCFPDRDHFRAHLLQPSAHVGGRHSADRGP